MGIKGENVELDSIIEGKEYPGSITDILPAPTSCDIDVFVNFNWIACASPRGAGRICKSGLPVLSLEKMDHKEHNPPLAPSQNNYLGSPNF